jgi:hypothetical protein
MAASCSSSSKSSSNSYKFVLFYLIVAILFSNDSLFSVLQHQVNQVNAEKKMNSENFATGGTDKKSLFYIYDWPPFLDDVWPPQNSTLHVKSGYDHGFYANRGAGKAISPDVGLFQTWQFSLYKNLMAR